MHMYTLGYKNLTYDFIYVILSNSESYLIMKTTLIILILWKYEELENKRVKNYVISENEEEEEILLLAPTNEPKASSTSKKRSKSSQQQQQKTREEENKEIPQQPYQGSWTNKASKSVR